jgi:hypothetical protein
MERNSPIMSNIATIPETTMTNLPTNLPYSVQFACHAFQGSATISRNLAAVPRFRVFVAAVPRRGT